jgi:hypothetical protein
MSQNSLLNSIVAKLAGLDVYYHLYRKDLKTLDLQ